jgi:cobaltochelatase CobN
MYEQVAQHYALDPAMRQFLGQSNPWALQAIGERLLEAAERGLWQAPQPETLAALQQTVDDTDRLLEVRGERD